MRTAITATLPLLLGSLLVLGGCGGSGSPDPVTVTLVAAFDNLNGRVGSTGQVDFGDPDVGDQTVGRGLRGFVSFEIGTLPAGATVESATLILQTYYVGGAPFTKLGSLLVDHVVYGTVLEAGAYARSPLTAGIGVLASDATLGPKSVVVTAQLQTDLLAGHAQSQYRLRFPVENNGDTVEDFADIYGASTAEPERRPRLVVTYR